MLTTEPNTDLQLLKLAREVAMEHHPIEDILQRFGIAEDMWGTIKTHPRFEQLLQSEVEAWQSAKNTHERVKLKAAIIMEEWLPESYARLHDQQENLNHKVELAKVISRLAGMDRTGVGVEGGNGEKFSVTINLGNDTIKLQNDITPIVRNERVIEHDPV